MTPIIGTDADWSRNPPTQGSIAGSLNALVQPEAFVVGRESEILARGIGGFRFARPTNNAVQSQPCARPGSLIKFVLFVHFGLLIMITFTASEAKQGLAKVIEAAAREPVVIRRQKRNVAVVLSMQEYERLVRFNITEFQRFCDQVGNSAQATGLDEATLAKLLADD